MARQMGKTFGVDLNVIGHRLDLDPCHMIVVFPTQRAGESQFEPRLMAMLRSVPSLAAKTATGQKNKKTAKLIGGVVLRIAWAGSPTELASQEAGLVVVDEYDRMYLMNREGDVLEIVEGAGSTYVDFKSIVTTTPTNGSVAVKQNAETGIEHWDVAEPDEVQSPTWKLWQEGTRYELACPCPYCGLYFVPRLRRLKWPEKATPAVAKRDAKLECPGCQMQIGDEHRPQLIARAEFLAPGQTVVDGEVVGPEPDSEDCSFWISGLLSPFRSFGQRAASYVAAVRSGDQARIQAVVNTQFAELWSIAGEVVKWERLKPLRQDYVRGTVPRGVRMIALTVDKQDDRFYWEVRGWGLGMQSWQLDCGDLIGDTTRIDGEAWDQLDVLRGQTFDGIPILLTLIDSGDDPEPVYAYVRRVNQREYCRATKGRDTMDSVFDKSVIDVSIRGKKIPQGIELWKVNTDLVKRFVHARFPASIDDTKPTGWFLAQDTPDEYLRHLVAEARLSKASGRSSWIRLKKANHYLDCAGLQVCAAYMRQVHRWTPENAPPLPRRAMEEPEPPAPAPAPTAGNLSVGGRRIRGRFG